MTTIRMTLAPAALSILLLAGCADDPRPRDDQNTRAAESFIGRQVARGMEEARRKLETRNLPIGHKPGIAINGRSDRSHRGPEGLPRAEITPEGDLVIAGETVPATPEQRELLLDYRRHVVDLAHAGMDVGIRGADIAGTAVSGIGEVLFGGSDGRKAYEARIEAEAEKIRQQARGLCALLPAMYRSQEALAASMPAFAPYATLRPEDIDECIGKANEALTTAADA